MNTATTQTPDQPGPGYWHDMAEDRLSAQAGLKPEAGATQCEKLLWKRIVALQAAAYRVLSDVDDDGVAEAHDMAVQGLREAVDAAPKALPGKRGPKGSGIPGSPANHNPVGKPMARTRTRPSVTLRRKGGWIGGSIGQMEALAGINVQSEAERRALWDRFRPLFTGDSQTLVDAVMDRCAAITLRRIKRGELSLLPRQ